METRAAEPRAAEPEPSEDRRAPPAIHIHVRAHTSACFCALPGCRVCRGQGRTGSKRGGEVRQGRLGAA
ncbi:hypothetical protein NDU88_002293 [Pleurodeles waltl]|uniref:Uncharacterized protein n=1 Tax=Pleurodeles waltl TaxID=8319 RepID=A0AAV7P6M2_PLEWA|nr:hypothetical protein NDU88_002293 [Pleurodeles waltl]